MPVLMALAGFAAGLVIGRLLPRRGQRAKADPAAEHRLRASDAELRVAVKRAESLDGELADAQKQLGEAEQELPQIRAAVAARDKQIAELEQTLADECAKTRDLRQELSDRAAETIRANVQVREMETELSVVQAGSEAVHEEIRRLIAERDQLTSRLTHLQQTLPDQADEPGEGPLQESYAVDC